MVGVAGTSSSAHVGGRGKWWATATTPSTRIPRDAPPWRHDLSGVNNDVWLLAQARWEALPPDTKMKVRVGPTERLNATRLR